MRNGWPVMGLVSLAIGCTNSGTAPPAFDTGFACEVSVALTVPGPGATAVPLEPPFLVYITDPCRDVPEWKARIFNENGPQYVGVMREVEQINSRNDLVGYQIPGVVPLEPNTEYTMVIESNAEEGVFASASVTFTTGVASLPSEVADIPQISIVGSEARNIRENIFEVFVDFETVFNPDPSSFLRYTVEVDDELGSQEEFVLPMSPTGVNAQRLAANRVAGETPTVCLRVSLQDGTGALTPGNIACETFDLPAQTGCQHGPRRTLPLFGLLALGLVWRRMPIAG